MMMLASVPWAMLSQCPCKGGGSSCPSSGVAPWLILAVALGVWLLAFAVYAVLKRKGASIMGKVGKIAIVVVLGAAVAAVIVAKQNGPAGQSAQPASPAAAGLPRLVDLGSTTCIPCKMMAPVLDGLRAEYAGRMQVEFIDVNVDPGAGKPYGIRLIPTQVFFDAAGKELWRHEGFISKDDILAKWKEFGVSFAATPVTASQPAGS